MNPQSSLGDIRAMQQEITKTLHDKFVGDIRAFRAQFGSVPYAHLTWMNSFRVSDDQPKSALTTWLTAAAREAFNQSISTLEIEAERVGKEHTDVETITAIDSGWYTNIRLEDPIWRSNSRVVTAIIEIGCYFNPPFT